MVRKKDPPAKNRRSSGLSVGPLPDYRHEDDRYRPINSLERLDPLETIDSALIKDRIDSMLYESENENHMIAEARQCIVNYREKKTKRDASPGEEAANGEGVVPFLRRCEEEARQRILLYQMSSKTQREVSFADEYGSGIENFSTCWSKDSQNCSHSLRQPEEAPEDRPEEPLAIFGIRVEEEQSIVEPIEKESDDLSDKCFGNETNQPTDDEAESTTQKKPDPVPVQTKSKTILAQERPADRTKEIPGRYIRTASFLHKEQEDDSETTAKTEEETTGNAFSVEEDDCNDYDVEQKVRPGLRVERKLQELRHKVLDPQTVSKMVAESYCLYSPKGKEGGYDDESLHTHTMLPPLSGFWGTFLEFLTTPFTEGAGSCSGLGPKSAAPSTDDTQLPLTYEMPLLSIQDGEEDVNAWGAGDIYHPGLKPTKIAKAINFSSKRLDKNYPLIALYDENKLRQEVHQVEVDLPDDERFEQILETEGYYDECFETRQGIPDAVVVKPHKADDISVLENNSIADSYSYPAYRSMQAWSLSPKRQRRLRAQAKAI